MKNILTILILAFSTFSQAQIINFPDANFKNALVNSKCVDLDGDGFGDADADLNNDGEIDMTEASSINSLNVSGGIINNLEGIANFKNLIFLSCRDLFLTSLNLQGLTSLTSLDCSYNELTSLNVQGLTNLELLYCPNNQLSFLNVQGLTNLTDLDCNSNQLTTLNVQGFTNLKNLKCAGNQLSTLDVQGLANLTDLVCSSNQLTSLNVKGLTNLVSLYCHYNQLTSLNVEGLTILEVLYCDNNQLTSLDVQGLTKLEYIDCNSNQLTSINVKGLVKLEQLYCERNQLASINVEGLTNLKALHCSHNRLLILYVQGLTNLISLTCSYNQLTSLNVQGLTFLSCNNNQLTSLNVQGLTNLTDLYCYNNQLTSLNIKGTKLDQALHFQNNPNLSYICCNEEIITIIKERAILNGQLNCEVNSYCSFTPGGKFYVLNGKTTFDGNQNGCDDQDLKLPNLKFKITNGTEAGAFISNSTGNYSIPVQEGTHQITPVIENPDYFTVTPSSFSVTFPNTSDTITQNFCITPKNVLHQLVISVIPVGTPARPGFDSSYKIILENKGNQIENGTLNFRYDEAILDFVSASQIPDFIADGLLKWDFSQLLPFERKEYIVKLNLNSPTETPPVNAGDKIYLTASIFDNVFSLEQTVVGSYDPNDKTCLQGDRIKPDMIGKYVDYLIRFENTGNYAAENVVVKDIIDTTRFDVSSLQITDASHEVYTRITGNRVEFIFENIQLPFDDAHNDGYIAFKIKTLPSLVVGNSLKNLADIYFDYNFPIHTNEAQSVIALPVATHDIEVSDIHVYPNPVKDVIYFGTENEVSKAEIFDINGRIIRSLSVSNNQLNIADIEKGVYLIKIYIPQASQYVKIVKI